MTKPKCRRRRVFGRLLAAVGLTLPVAGSVVGFWQPALAATLQVGPGKPFARIEDANAKAKPGDVILVSPRENDLPYEKVGVYVREPNLTFRAAPVRGTNRVKISGKGFDHSGRGSIPRAIFQFNRGADHCVLEGFELFGAHNESHNGAGVRINQANHVTIRNCNIHHNDMGIMSNGDGRPTTAVNQRIENCSIHHNGDFSRPGFNHNLYLGGASVTLSGCDIHHSLTGHNVKSRAHHTRVEYCYVHDSANREFDLVDHLDTVRPDSHAVLIGNCIVKDPHCEGNRGVIHFGQDGGGEHNGTLHLVHNTIVTPFISPVIALSARNAKAHLVGNLICDAAAGQHNQKIAHVRHGASLQNITGQHNWFSGGFSAEGNTRLSPKTNHFTRFDVRLFVNPSEHNYRLTQPAAKAVRMRSLARTVDVPATPGKPEKDHQRPLLWQYRHPGGKETRPAAERPTVGAFAPMIFPTKSGQ